MPSTKKSYQHIKKAERLEIAILLKRRYTYGEIAQVLGRSKSTIWTEIRQNKVKGIYDPDKAHHKAYVRRKYSKYQGMKIVQNWALRDYVEDKITEEWSPQEISGRLREVETHLTYASPRVIYKFIYSFYGQDLKLHLRHYYPKRRRKAVKVSQLKDRVFIDSMPTIIEEKQRFYDWEGDFLVSGKQGKGVLLVLYERKSQFGLIKKLPSQSPQLIKQIFEEIVGGKIYFNSLTLDNDLAFRKHGELSRIIGAPIYFCHPYHSWEKGGVENFNKLIRQYIPKGSNIAEFDEEYIREIQDKLNNRPRKNLSYQTPLEVLTKEENAQFSLTNYFDTIKQNLVKQKILQRSA